MLCPIIKADRVCYLSTEIINRPARKGLLLIKPGTETISIKDMKEILISYKKQTGSDGMMNGIIPKAVSIIIGSMLKSSPTSALSGTDVAIGQGYMDQYGGRNFGLDGYGRLTYTGLLVADEKEFGKILMRGDSNGGSRESSVSMIVAKVGGPDRLRLLRM